MSNQRDKNRGEADRVQIEIAGEDPSRSGVSRDRQDQRVLVAEIMRQLLDRGMDRLVLIEAFIAGAAWLGDQEGVSREQMARALVQVSMAEGRSLIFQPSSSMISKLGGGR